MQTASARYFQRPDNDHADYDPTRTTLGGSAGSAYLTRTGNDSNLRFQTGAAWRSPGFEINDIGYMRRADEINQSSWVGWTRRNPFSIFNHFSVNANQWLNWDTGGNFLGAAVNMNANWDFRNRSGCYLGVTHAFEEVSNTALRGGPASKWPATTEFNLNLWSDHAQDVRYSLGGWALKSAEDHLDLWSAWTSIAVRPSDALQIRLNPSFNRSLREQQYVGADAFGDQDRYLFGSLDQRTFSLTFRVDYSVRPNLTIQYYGSPFVASGRYSSFKRVTDPMADAYGDRFHTFAGDEIVHDAAAGLYEVDENRDGTVDYTIDDPDFSLRDFNSNLVVRWEYRPGSTFYLVWSQARSEFLNDGAFHIREDIDDLFQVHPHNVFLVKFNRWFSL